METISRRESKFYVINFIDPPNNFFKKRILTPRVVKTQLKNCVKKVSGKEGNVSKGCEWFRKTLLLMLRYIYFS